MRSTPTLNLVRSMGARLFLVLVLSAVLVSPAGALSTDHGHDGSHGKSNPAVDRPVWLDKLENQLNHEDTMSGLEGSQEKLDKTFMKLMGQLQNKLKEHASPASSGGGFHDSWSAHQLGASYLLGPTEAAAKVYKGAHCAGNAPTKKYEISAINVEVTLNQWGDYYPGYMYVLDKDIGKVRDEEKRNLVARKKKDGLDPGAVSTGLQGDAIQPMTIRGNQGDCVRVKFTNRLEDEDAGFQISGSAMIISSSGQPNTAATKGSIVASGESQEYEWYIPVDEQEGSHMIQNHAGRDPSALGLIGAFIVEPRGSRYLDPFTGGPLENGWMAMIANDDARDFREFALFYHEIGDESFRPLNRHGEMIPQRDPLTDAYRPSARAMNFRSEPFGINNLAQQEKHFHYEDESLSYSSYTFADAPTTIPRSYLGDPAKFRLIHGGGEVFHSHHPHGGSIRWTRSPQREVQLENLTQAAYDGPVKFPVVRTTTDRVDVEVIGPAEALDLETECGSGLCQRLAGDFLFHCHVAHHYVAGMWGYWRVYNTLQDGNYPLGSTDVMRPLKELPDRAGRIPKGQSSDKLVGKTMDWFGKKFKVVDSGKSDWTKETPVVNIKDWVKYMLPPKGKPGHTDDEKGQILAYDGSVWDYGWKGNQALSERESTLKIVKYISPRPGKRHPIQFDQHGKLAWPHMTPHFGKRVPFARNHGGAPWLEPFHLQTDNDVITSTESGSSRSGPHMENTGGAKPGEQGRWSLCPPGAGRKQYNLVFINTPIELSGAVGSTPPIIDKYGLIYVIDEDMAEVKADPKKAIPLVIRANVYDCVDLLLTSEWNDDDFTNFQMSKLNIHPHFFQFDNQASDGVISGFSYDQSMRSYRQFTKKMKDGHHVGMPVPMNAKLLKSTNAGDNTVQIQMAEHSTPFHAGADIIVGIEVPNGKDARWIKSISPDPTKGLAKDGKYTIKFTEAMTHGHKAGQIVSTEYVRYRWWVDVDMGLVFWHDHAFGATTWPHGGIGSTIVEPWGSTYHDPKTGEPIRSGVVADIHGTEPFAYGRNGSFREIVVQLHDTVPHTAQLVTAGNPPGLSRENAIAAGQSISFQMPKTMQEVAFPHLNGGTHTTGGGFNFRAASLSARLLANPDASQMFSSRTHRDPDTPMIRAYVGDNVVFRMLHGMMNETHVFSLSGHGFRPERYDPTSRVTNALHIGIAERYDLAVTAGGYQSMAGDYLMYDGRTSHLSEGSWSIFRVHDKKQKDLRVLPGNENFAKKQKSTLCPKGAPVKSFSVVAIDKALKFNANAEDEIEVDFERKLQLANANGKIFALEGEAKQAASDGRMPHPLTLRANIGDCIKVKLTNRLKDGNASLHANNLAFDPLTSQGINVGNNPGDQTVAPGKSKNYTYYAHPDYNINGALIWDFGNLTTNVRDGLYGGIIIGPRGSVYRDPETGKDISQGNSWKADVIIDKSYPENRNIDNYRDFALYFQDEDNILGTSFMPYLQNVAGLTGVNYRLEPWTYREDEGCELGNMFTACVAADADPATPTIRAHAGDNVMINVFGAHNEQNQMFNVDGHQWRRHLNQPGSDMIDVEEFGGSEYIQAFFNAGGSYKNPGTYLWMNGRTPYKQAGQWGYMKVLPSGDRSILPLGKATVKGVKTASQPDGAEKSASKAGDDKLSMR
ncbi:MAG: multicopper oxidase domain-containing protein [Nitrospina sp.]|nr:multicopper oxidase domain-containing protein [Nitrospina sp.]